MASIKPVLQFNETSPIMPLPWEEIERIKAELQDSKTDLVVGTPGLRIEYPQSQMLSIVGLCCSLLGLSISIVALVISFVK